MNAQKILVTRSAMPPFEEYINAIKPLWESCWLTNNGAIHQKLETELADYLKVKNVVLFTNGHLALYAAIQALNLTGEVITTPFSFVSTTHAIVQNGLKPVFCDIRPDDCTMDADQIESLITDKTSAIVPVHVFGNPCEVHKIEHVAIKYGLKVIYDAAHAFGVLCGGRGIGEYGDISMFSFHATKLYHSAEGGALTFNDDSYKSVLNSMKNFGFVSEDEVDSVGFNAKMNEFQAAMGLCNVRSIDENINIRRTITERYEERLSGIEGIAFKSSSFAGRNFAYVPLAFDPTVLGFSRDDVVETLKRKNIFPRKYFYPLITDFRCYKDDFDSCKTPVAKNLASEILTLPIYPTMDFNIVDLICDKIGELTK